MSEEKEAFSIDWIEPNRAFSILIHVEQLTESDVAAIQADASSRYRKATRSVHVVIDLMSLRQLTTHNVNGSLSSIRPVTEKNRGETIIVVSPTNPLVEFMTGATMKGLAKPFHLCHTMKEALNLLASFE